MTPIPRPGFRRAAPWADLARDGWRPTLEDVRAGFAGHRPGLSAPPVMPASREAAILVPLFDLGGEAQVVLIERSHSTGSHRGEIAFPGGVLDAGESPAEAAVRETEEEIGIPPDVVEIVASLDAVPTNTAFLIRPHVGLLARVPSFTVNAAEVARVMTASLADLAQEDAQWWEPFGSTTVQAYAIQDTVGWGTTASLLSEVLAAAAAGRRRRLG